MADYIKWIRGKVGHDAIILSFSVVIITNDKGEVLLQKRSDKENLWGLPGGTIEIGESIEEAAIRELKEETGLDIQVDYLIGVYSKYFTEYPNGDKAQSICYLFKGNAINGALSCDNEETFDLRYFDKNSIPKLFLQQHTDMINDFFQDKRGIYR